MRIVVLSDSHRKVSKLFDAVERHLDNADLFIFLGDGEDDFDMVLNAYPHIKYEAIAIGAQIIRIKWKSNLPAKKYSFHTGIRIM
jgi:predicted phosphodiesterase